MVDLHLSVVFQALHSGKSYLRIQVSINTRIHKEYVCRNAYVCIYMYAYCSFAYLHMMLYKIRSFLQDDKLSGLTSSVDVATKKNMNDLVKVGEGLLKKPVSSVNLTPESLSH